MCWDFWTSLYAGTQMLWVAMTLHQRHQYCLSWQTVGFVALRWTESLLWFSIQQRDDNQNNWITTWIVPSIFTLQLWINYKCSKTKLPMWWLITLVCLVIGLYYFFHNMLTTTKQRKLFLDYPGFGDRYLVMGDSALPTYMSLFVNIFIYRPQSSDPSTWHWLVHSTFIIACILASLSDYVTPMLCTNSVLQSLWSHL
jgi:hypothetical protein